MRTVPYYVGVEGIPWGTKYQIDAILWVRNCISVDFVVIWLWDDYAVNFVRNNVISCYRAGHISTKHYSSLLVMI